MGGSAEPALGLAARFLKRASCEGSDSVMRARVPHSTSVFPACRFGNFSGVACASRRSWRLLYVWGPALWGTSRRGAAKWAQSLEGGSPSFGPRRLPSAWIWTITGPTSTLEDMAEPILVCSVAGVHLLRDSATRSPDADEAPDPSLLGPLSACLEIAGWCAAAGGGRHTCVGPSTGAVRFLVPFAPGSALATMTCGFMRVRVDGCMFGASTKAERRHLWANPRPNFGPALFGLFHRPSIESQRFAQLRVPLRAPWRWARAGRTARTGRLTAARRVESRAP